jgi:hypothetical protein
MFHPSKIMNARDLAAAAECSTAAIYKWKRQGKLPDRPYKDAHVAIAKQLLADGRRIKAANVNQPIEGDIVLTSVHLYKEDAEWLKSQPGSASAIIRDVVRKHRSKFN